MFLDASTSTRLVSWFSMEHRTERFVSIEPKIKICGVYLYNMSTKLDHYLRYCPGYQLHYTPRQNWWDVCVKGVRERLDNEESDRWCDLAVSYSRQTHPQDHRQGWIRSMSLSLIGSQRARSSFSSHPLARHWCGRRPGTTL